MVRSIAVIIAAIQLSNPGLSYPQVESYAKVVQEEAKKRHFDPFSLVSIIHFESWWRPGAVNPNGEDWGLAQAHVPTFPACRQDMESDACKAIKQRFLNPIYSIRWAAARITVSRDFCRKHTGGASYHGWLSAWQGTHKRGKWCRANKHTRLRVNYRAKLVRMANQGRLKPKGKPKAPQRTVGRRPRR